MFCHAHATPASHSHTAPATAPSQNSTTAQSQLHYGFATASLPPFFNCIEALLQLDFCVIQTQHFKGHRVDDEILLST